jgi:hypothetical protein
LPQVTHEFSESQTDPVLHVIDSQQVWVLAPHGSHSPSEHRNPSAHIDPPQHICPRPPQSPHVPLAQASSAELHAVPQQT